MKKDRTIAFEILSQHRYTNLELQKLSQHPSRGFITRLVYTVLQNYEALVFQTADFLNKPVPDEIEIILAMAAAQHYLMDSVADYALVNESVNLTKEIKPGFAGLVNAVLKKMILREFQISQSDNEVLNLSINTSHPLWITKLIVKQYGKDEAENILKHHNTQPPLYLRHNPKKIDLENFIHEYPVKKIDNTLIGDAEIFRTDAFDKGYILAQDINSIHLVNELDISNTNSLLDACCGPGTKLTQIALNIPEAQIVGIDLHQHRIDLTQELLDRWGIKGIDLIVMDILDYQPSEKFDTIFMDVPCSGLGVMRRKPDIKRRIQPSDLDSLQNLQRDMLEVCSSFLSPHGQLIYATCTLNKKENEKQIEAFLDRHPEFECSRSETLLGYKNDGDSFYLAILSHKIR